MKQPKYPDPDYKEIPEEEFVEMKKEYAQMMEESGEEPTEKWQQQFWDGLWAGASKE